MTKERMNIGNVDFDKDSVLCAKYKYENGQKLNYVFLVGGTKIMFPDQEISNAFVPLDKIYNKEIHEISNWLENIKGLIIEDSPQKINY